MMDSSEFYILVVEDEDELREMIVEELSDAGYTTRQACDGADGLKAILEQPPDLVLCDITMPKMNGYELLKEVKQTHTSLGEIDFVFLSALAEKEQVLEGLRLGADDYLTKPVDYDLLLAKVEGRLREVVRRREVREDHLVKLYKALSPEEESAAGGDARAPHSTVSRAGDRGTPPPEKSRAPRAVNLEQFKKSVARIAQDNTGRVVAGHLQVIGLDSLRERLGEKWPRLAERINRTAEQTIRNRLAAQDVLTRNRDGNFVVCFAQLNEQAAAVKAQALTNEICNKLLGETPEADSLSVTAEVHSLEIAPAEMETEPAEDLLSSVTSRLAEMAEQVRGQAKASLAELHRTAELELIPVWTSSGQATPLAIATFDSSSNAVIDHITLAKGDTKETAADVDILTLGKVCERIYSSIHGENTMVVTPVSYQTISSPKLAKNFIGICENLLPAAKERLIFNVKGTPHNLLDNDLSIARLSAHSKFRMVQLDSAELGNIDLQNQRINLVCMAHGTLAQLLRTDRHRVEGLIGAIHEQKARVLIHDIPPDAKDAMSEEAVDFLSFREI